MRLAVAFFLFLLPTLSVAAAEMRVISGSLIYRERIALAPETELMVELRDEAGTVLATLRRPGGGAQVPLPFVIEGPDDVALVLRAALRSEGAIRWLSPPVAIDAGPDPVDLGEVVMRPHRPMGFATMLSCGELTAELGFVGAGARLRVGGSYWDLVPDRTASGSKFTALTDPGTWIWTHGDAATLSLNGAALPECREMLPESRYVARGNEPGWSVQIGNGQMHYVGDYGATVITTPLPEPRIEAGARVYDPTDVDIVLRLEAALCHDDMTGMPYPDRAEITTGGRLLRGCGGDPLELLIAHPWRVEDIAGGGVIDSSMLSLRFSRAGRLAGTGGCNRYSGSFSLGGEGLSIGPVAATMMACPEALMRQERRFFDALDEVMGFDIAPNGALLLMAGEIPVITARR